MTVKKHNERDIKGKAAAAVNWEEVRARIKATDDAISAQTVCEDRRRKTLKERAARLAEPTAAPRAGACVDVVEFILASERYAVESAFIREICPLHELTNVPCAPAFVLGIINVRGQILSVIDIKKFFALPEKGITDLNKVIILSLGGMEFGLIADAIAGVKHINEAGIGAALPTITGIGAQYIKGVTEERLVIIDAEKLLTDKGIIVEQSVEL